MAPLALVAYAGLVAGLVVKYGALIAVQGRHRLKHRTFRWPEDAAHWGGAAAGEGGPVERAQAALRNDGESQPLFLAAAGLWVALGAGGALALGTCAAYVLARSLHSAWLVWPRQPHRNRAFVAGQACLLLALADACRLALAR